MLENNTGCGAIILIIGIILGGIAGGVALSDKIKGKISDLTNAPPPPPPNDIIHFSNSSSFNTGVLVDGKRGSSDVDDEPYTGSTGADIILFYLTSLPGEVIGFAQNAGSPPFPTSLPPTLKTPLDEVNPLAWTPDTDNVSFTFSNEYLIDVSIWIIFTRLDIEDSDTYDSQRDMALEAIRNTVDIWTTEGQGIRFRDYNIIDRTNDDDPQKKALEDRLSNPNSAVGCTDIADLVGDEQENKRFTDRIINIYYVPRVQSSSEVGSGSTSGTHCAGSFAKPYHVILMGTHTNHDLLVHEIGHALSLEHINAFNMDFKDDNVMHSASTTRRYLTEGQTFRSVVNIASALNDPSTYNARQGLPQRECNNLLTVELGCPEIQKRIWSP